MLCLLVLARWPKWLLSGDFWKGRVIGVGGGEIEVGGTEGGCNTAGHGDWTRKKGMEESIKGVDLKRRVGYWIDSPVVGEIEGLLVGL